MEVYIQGDWFMGVISLAKKLKLPYKLILEALSMGFLFEGNHFILKPRERSSDTTGQ